MNLPQQEKLTVTIAGVKFQAFQNLTFSRSIGSLCGQFQLDCFPDAASSIKPGDSVSISYQQEPLLTGTIDQIAMGISSDSHTLKLSGRDQTSILVDSSCIHSPMGFASITLSEMARKMCKPLGVKVKSPIREEASYVNWYINYGETVFEVMDRMAKLEGTLLLTDGLGSLLIETPSMNTSGMVQIIEGVNLLDCSYSYNQAGLFKTYMITSFAQGLNNEVAKLDQLTDEKVFTNKTLIIDSEGLTAATHKGSLLKRRLKYEMSMRRARALEFHVEVPGWVDASQNVFRLNTLASVEIPRLGIQDYYLICGLQFRIDQAQGYVTQISLCEKDAFQADPMAEARRNQAMDWIRKAKEAQTNTEGYP